MNPARVRRWRVPGNGGSDESAHHDHIQAVRSAMTALGRDGLIAARPTLPMGTKAVFTNLQTGSSVAVTINDRGPYARGPKIGLSRAAAQTIGMGKTGVAKVTSESKPRRPRIKKKAPPTMKKRSTPVAPR